MSVLIPLASGGYAVVDEEDVPLVSGYRWHVQHNYYKGQKGRPAAVATTTKDGTVLMHRLITGAQDGQVVDHIDGVALNNTRKNLRVCSHAENMMNRRRHANNTSGFKGVYRVGDAPELSPRWRAAINHRGVKHNLGTFKTPEEAASAYREAAYRLHGQFARVA